MIAGSGAMQHVTQYTEILKTKQALIAILRIFLIERGEYMLNYKSEHETILKGHSVSSDSNDFRFFTAKGVHCYFYSV